MARAAAQGGWGFVGTEVARGALQAVGGIAIYGLALWLVLSSMWERLFGRGRADARGAGAGADTGANTNAAEAVRRAIQLRSGGLLVSRPSAEGAREPPSYVL